jgi:hypothetical protein
MIALIRKDVPWLLAFAISGVVIHLIGELTQSTFEVWLLPRSEYLPGSLLFHAFAASLLGVVMALHDDLLRTREYVRHRPVSLQRLFWTRQLGAALVLITWIVLVPTLHYLITSWASGDASLLRARRLVTFYVVGTSAFTFYAVALFFATATRRLLLTLPVVGGAATFVLMIYAGPWVMRTPGRFAELTTLAVLPFAGLFLLGALRNEQEGRDLDRPWSNGWCVRCGTLVVVVAALGTSFLLFSWQKDGLQELAKQYPVLTLLRDQRYVMTDQHQGRTYLVNAQHERTSALPAPKPDGTSDVEAAFRANNLATAVLPPDEPHASGWQIQDAHRDGRVMCGVHGQTLCTVDAQGHFDLYHLLDEDGQGPYHRRLLRPDGRPFSPRAHLVGHPWPRIVLMGDPAEGRLWMYDLQSQATAFASVPLPGGDRYVEDLSTRWLYPGQPGEAGAPLFANDVIVQGARGVYMAAGDRFEPAPADVAARLRERQARFRHRDAQYQRFTRDVHTPLSFTIRVTAQSGSPAFAHTFTPHRPMERALAVLFYGSTVVRAPALTLASLLVRRDHRQAGQELMPGLSLLDLAVVLGDRRMVVANVLLALLLGGLTVARGRKLPLPRGRQLFWVSAVLLTGLTGYIAFRAFETRCAWRKLEVPADAPPHVLAIAS